MLLRKTLPMAHILACVVMVMMIMKRAMKMIMMTRRKIMKMKCHFGPCQVMPTGQRLAKQSESEAEQENSSNSTLEKAVVVVILVMVGDGEDGEDSGQRL